MSTENQKKLKIKKVIKVENLNFTYKEKDVMKKLKGEVKPKGVEDINFYVGEGEIVSILGLNGAGKTTTLKCLLGLNTPKTGVVKLFDEDVVKNGCSKEIAEKIAYLPEVSYYPKSLKLKDVMDYYGELYSIPKKERMEKIDIALKIVGLFEQKNNKLKKFSKGMLQKVGIAQTILNNPKLIFLDEPMSGLDPISREQVIEMLLRLKSEGTTILFNTHLLEDVATVSDRAIIINDGKIIDTLDIKEMLKSEENFSLKEYFLTKLNYKKETNLKTKLEIKKEEN